jgi:KDO2-lipid IV(A) lauroyltransferase
MRFLLAAITRIPLPVLYGASWFVYVVAFHLLRWRRDQVARDLAISFPERTGAERAAILRQSYRNLADTMMEIIWGFGASAEAITRRVSFENTDIIDRIAAVKGSVVLLAAHHGNWEWLLPAGSAHFRLPIDAVYQPQRVASIDAFLREARARFGGRPIPQSDFVYELMVRAGQPRGYALIADQTPRRDDPKHWTRFLNRDTAFFVGAEKVARFLDAPVLFVAMRRARRGHYSVRLVPLAEPPYDTGAEDDGSPIMERFARSLEALVLESPADFLWLQKRWKYPRPQAESQTASVAR